jgi:hypothetical protein
MSSLDLSTYEVLNDFLPVSTLSHNLEIKKIGASYDVTSLA